MKYFWSNFNVSMGIAGVVALLTWFIWGNFVASVLCVAPLIFILNMMFYTLLDQDNEIDRLHLKLEKLLKDKN